MLDSIIGQKVVKRMLINEIERGQLPQTLLFFGPDGSGKFLTALELSRIVNCFKDKSDNCSCKSCYAIRKLNSPNLLILSKANLKNSFDIWFKYGVDEKSYPYFYRDVVRLIIQKQSEKYYNDINLLREALISYEALKEQDIRDILNTVEKLLSDSKENTVTIDEIREIQRFLHHTSGLYKKKIVIIDGADYMNEEASNSFLKISEDTPENSLIILTAVNKKRIKDTIVSRSRNYRFIGLTSHEIKEILYRIYKRDILFDNNANSDNILTILKEIYKNKNNFEIIFNIVQNIVKDGVEIEIIDYLEKAYIEKIHHSEGLSIKSAYELENKLKELDDEKRKLRSTNVNRELSLANFFVNTLLY